MKTKSPTLLEIATSFTLWQEYADPSGIYSKEQFDARSASENLALLQQCGFHMSYTLAWNRQVRGLHSTEEQGDSIDGEFH